MKKDLEVRLYDRDLAAPTLQEDIHPQSLKFSTRLHGGFHLCNFRLRMNYAQAWKWVEEKMFYRIVVADGPQTLWEGRIQDIVPSIGYIDVTAYSYYSSLTDGKYSTAYNNTIDVVTKAILTAQCPQINADQTHIAAVGGPAHNNAADTSYLDKSPQELIEKMAAFGGASNENVYFAIWEDRIPYLFVRDLSAINWKVEQQDLKYFLPKKSTADLWNAVYAIYQAGGALTRTATSLDTDSQTKYGVTRTYAIPDLGSVAAANAQAIRDTWLNEHKEIYPTPEEFVIGDTVKDIRGVSYPSNWVRAGQVIRILDLIPVSSDLDSISRESFSTFYITETEFDMETQTNSIKVDIKSKSLQSLIAQMISRGESWRAT